MEERAGGGALEEESRAEPRLLQFDDFRVDPMARGLWRGGEAVALTPKAFSLLLVLLERPGEVVSKDELFRRVWERGTASEANLTQCVSTLRKALGESASERRYVVTVPGQGYCFGSAVIEVVPSAISSPIQARPALRTPKWRRRLLEAFAILLICSAVSAWVLLSRAPAESSRQDRPALAVLGLRNLSGRSGREEDGLASTLSGMLTTRLTAADRLRVISDERRADLVVSGSFLALGGETPRRIRLDLRVQAKGGETLVALAEVGTEERLSELVERAAGRLMEELDVNAPAPPAGPLPTP